MSTPYERLMAEEIPAKPPAKPELKPWTDDDRDAHWRALCESVGARHEKRPHHAPSTPARPQLRLIHGQPDPNQPDAA